MGNLPTSAEIPDYMADGASDPLFDFHRFLAAGVINPNSEVGNGPRAAARGAHAAGVSFSAARRKLRTTPFFVRG